MINQLLKELGGLLARLLRIAVFMLVLLFVIRGVLFLDNPMEPWESRYILPMFGMTQFHLSRLSGFLIGITGWLIFICFLLALARALEGGSAHSKKNMPKKSRKCIGKRVDEKDDEKEDLEEARMVQEIYNRLFKMDERVEALETVLLERYGKELNK